MLLDLQLRERVYRNRKKRLASLRDVLYEIKKRSEVAAAISPETVKAGIEHLVIREVEERDSLSKLILDCIEKIGISLPKEQTVAQSPDRFKALPDEGVSLKIAKAGKRILRRIGKKEWLQNIPVQNVVVYHLLDAVPIYMQWIEADAGQTLQCIHKLDKALRKRMADGVGAASTTSVEHTIDELTAETEHKLQKLEKDLTGDYDKICADVQRALEKAGTIEQRAGFYDADCVAEKRSQTAEMLLKQQKNWHAAIRRVASGTTVLFEFIDFCKGLNQVETDFRKNLHAFLDQLLLNALGKYRGRISKIRDSISDKADLPAALDRLTNELLPQFRQDVLETLEKSRKQNKMQQFVHKAGDEVLQHANGLSENAVFILELDHKNHQVMVNSQEVDWRELIVRAAKTHIINPLGGEKEAIHQVIHERVKDLQEVEDIIHANVETARELLTTEQPEEDPRQLTDQALQRIEAKFERNGEEVKEFGEKLIGVYSKGRAELKAAISELVLEPDSQQLHLLDAKYKISEKKLDFSTRLRRQKADFDKRSAILTRFMGRKVKSSFHGGRILLGFEKRELASDTQADIAAYLSVTEKRVMELPYIYRRLFDFRAEPDPEYHVGWKEQKADLFEVFSYWKEGLSAAIAVKGEKGSGKSTYMDLAQSAFADAENIERISVDGTVYSTEAFLSLLSSHFKREAFASNDDLIHFLKENFSGSIIIFEGMQNLYLRTIRGYEALEQFSYIIAETSTEIFWMVSCSEYAWTFMAQTFNVGEYFSHTAKTDQLNEPEIKKVVLNRHRPSGYELIFIPSDRDKKSRAYKKLMNNEEKVQRFLRDKYFASLSELAQGNASVAIIFWLRSIRRFDDMNFYIEPLEAASLDVLEDLKPDTLFVLAALVLHDTLLAEELSSVLNISIQTSRIMLRRLKRKGVVVESTNGFTLNHLVYRQVVNELKKRNILHLSE